MNRRPLFILLLFGLLALGLLFSDIWGSGDAQPSLLVQPEAAEAQAHSADLPIAGAETGAGAQAEAVKGSSSREEVPLVDSTEGAEAPNSEHAAVDLLRVRVQDLEGQAIKRVPVSLWTLNRGRYYPWKVEETQQDGIASFSLAMDEESRGLKLAVGFMFPYAGSKTVLVDRSELPTEPIVLQLEATGSVAVQFRTD